MYDTVLTAVVYVRPGPHLESVCYLTGETSILMQNHIGFKRVSAGAPNASMAKGSGVTWLYKEGRDY